MTRSVDVGTTLPLTLYCFDLLHVDDRDLLDEPLSERAAVMQTVLPSSLIVPRTVASDLDAVEAAFAGAVAAGFEGAVVKKLHAPYAAGRRDSGAWGRATRSAASAVVSRPGSLPR